MPEQNQASRRFGSVTQRDRGRGYARRDQAGFQQIQRYEQNKNLVGPAQMEPGTTNFMGPIRAAIEGQRQQRREANQQRRYAGGRYGAATPTRFSRQTRVGNMMAIQGSSSRRGGGQVMVNLGGAASSGAFGGGYRGSYGVSAPGASTRYSNGRIVTRFGS